MNAFDIPSILCDVDEPETTVKITLNCAALCGSLEYIGGKRDGETIIFGTKTVDGPVVF